MSAKNADAPYGFMLITSDPTLHTGVTGSAWELVGTRLAMGRWPIYRHTRNRVLLRVGSRLAFYVAGQGPRAGTIVATAEVESVVANARTTQVVDPPKYLTNSPFMTLRLARVIFLDEPIALRDVVSKLSFAPKRMRSWGILVQGGVRALNAVDWSTIFHRRRGTRTKAG